MILIWKKKGILGILYLIFFFFIVLLISETLSERVGGIFATSYNRMWLYGITCILSGIATIYTDIYTIENKKIVRDDYQFNEIFYLPMKLFGKLILIFGILNVIAGILEG